MPFLIPVFVAVGAAAVGSAGVAVGTGAAVATAGVIGTTTAAVIGAGATAAVAGGIAYGAHKLGESSGKREAYETLAGVVGKASSDSIVNLAEEERRRRLNISNAKNNMNNILSGASSDSSTAPLLKTTLGSGSVLG
jgi:hypothetical protein